MIYAELLILIVLLVVNIVLLILTVKDRNETIDFLFNVIRSLTNKIKRMEEEKIEKDENAEII